MDILSENAIKPFIDNFLCGFHFAFEEDNSSAEIMLFSNVAVYS